MRPSKSIAFWGLVALFSVAILNTLVREKGPITSPGVLLPSLALFVLAVFVHRRNMRNLRTMNEGNTLNLEGRFSEALGVFDTLGNAWPSVPALPLFRGTSLLGLWRLEELRRS